MQQHIRQPLTLADLPPELVQELHTSTCRAQRVKDVCTVGACASSNLPGSLAAAGGALQIDEELLRQLLPADAAAAVGGEVQLDGSIQYSLRAGWAIKLPLFVPPRGEGKGAIIVRTASELCDTSKPPKDIWHPWLPSC